MASAPIWLGPQPAVVNRIVSLAPSLTEILCSLDTCERIVGVTKFDDYPEQVRSFPKVGGFVDPDLETIVRLQPDLVIAIPTSAGRAKMDKLATLGHSVLVLPATSVDDLWLSIDVLGSVLKKGQKAAELTAKLKNAMSQIANRYAKASRRRVLVIVGRQPLVAAGPQSFLQQLVELVHGVNVLTQGGHFPVLDLEVLLHLHPDVIVDVAEEANAEIFWKTREAILGPRSRVHLMHNSSLLRLGPRLPDGLQQLATALWPENP